MLLHTGSGPNLLLSIPRDSIVDIPGHPSGKINAAYAFGGPELLVQTIEQNTGVRIDDYVEIGMGGVAGIVDAVGGIEVCPKTNMKDKLAGLDIKKGCQEVDGATALAYARSRHTSGIGDIDRVRRQREVVSAVGSEVLSPWTVINPVRYWRLNNAIPDFFTFGEGMGPVRSAHVGDGDDPGERRQGAHLRRTAAGPRGALGPREGPGDVRQDHQGRDRHHRRRPLFADRRHPVTSSLYETLSVSLDEDGVATLTLDRPGQLNAFDLTMARDLERFFLTDARSDDVRAVVVTGAGRAFCAGMDLSREGNVFGLDESLAPTPEEFRAHYDEPPYHDGLRDSGGRVTLAVYALPKPVIAAINGAAVGIGATMTLGMDIRMASTEARIGFVFGRIGITPEAASSWFLPRIVGLQQALEWIYAADILTAEAALAGRLVRSVHPPDELLPRGAGAGPVVRPRPLTRRARAGQAAALPARRLGRALGSTPLRLARGLLDVDVGRQGGRGGVPREAAGVVHREGLRAAPDRLAPERPRRAVPRAPGSAARPRPPGTSTCRSSCSRAGRPRRSR